jgi:hypothetical protein
MKTFQHRPFTLILVVLLYFLGVVIGAGCDSDTESPPQHINLVGGNWDGTLDSASLFLTFIEGEFEGGVTVGGSGHISYPPNSQIYAIMGGGHNNKDLVYFGLYDIRVDTKGDFVMEGYVHGTTIIGTYRHNAPNGDFIKTGSWEVHRLYAD